MRNHRILVICVAALLLVVGCRRSGSDRVPASVPGTYVYAAKGSTLKKPWEFSARLDLTRDNRYTFTLDKTIEGNRDATETNVGTFTLDGDRIVLHESRRDGRPQDMHKLVIKADSLIAEVGWTTELFIKGVGAPNVVFVKQRT
jgi:hypothetical protein